MLSQRDEHLPGILMRIGYDPARETDAFSCLSRGRVDDCARQLWSLVRGLDLPASETDSRHFNQLLHDILQKLNRRLNRGPGKDSRYQATRVRLIERFSRSRASEQTRRVFRRELRRLATDGALPTSRTQGLAMRARSFIEANYANRTSLSTVAEHLCVSANYLSRVFRRETGMTLTSYIQRVRIDHARRLLAEGRESISEIAYRVGYRNYRDFYRNFVKQEKASPRQVRERISRVG